MEIREDSGSAEELLRHGLALSRELRELNLGAWPELRNRDDFNAIYWLPASQRSPLERVYLKGRDFANQLSSVLSTFNDVGEYPTFESFVDAVHDSVSSRPSDLEHTLAEAEAILASLEDPPGTINLMLELAGRQLAIAAALEEWLRASKNTPLYRRTAGQPAATPSRLPERAVGVLGRHGWALILSLLAVASGMTLAAILL